MPSVLSLQTGRVSPLGPKDVPSAFVKRPITGSVRAQVLGLEGDEQADHRVHGGPDKAVYFYPSEHYPNWIAEAPQHEQILTPGAFGENVTSVGLDEQTIAIGDVLEIGSAQMQVTEPRQPCFKLALRFNDKLLGRAMMQTGRTGWYVRVLKTGELRAGDPIRIARRPNPHWTIGRFNQFIIGRSASNEELSQLLELEGLAADWQKSIREALATRDGA